MARPIRAEAAAAGLAHDRGLASAHTAMAWVHWALDWDYEASRRERELALKLGPSDPEAHIQAALLDVMDDPERAFAHGEFALRVNPLSEWTHVQLAWSYYFGEQPARVLEQSLKTLQRFPDSLMAWYTLGLSYLALGRAHDGVAAFERATSHAREPVGLAYLGCAYALAGRREEARALLDVLLARKAQRFVPPRPFILLYTALGEIDRALDLLEEAYRERDPFVLGVPGHSLLVRLRGHPRFETIVERLAAIRGQLSTSRTNHP